MKITVAGTGYVGLVTGVSLSEIGHEVICFDIDTGKVQNMKKGLSPIFEPGLEVLMSKNLEAGHLHFTSDAATAFKGCEVVFIAVGTPKRKDGSADLSAVEKIAMDLALNIANHVIIVIKSTVPVGTNEKIRDIVQQNLRSDVRFEMAANPEFLREGSAVQDTFYGDRIVIGTDQERTANVMENLYRPLGIPVFKTGIREAEMIKYASNAYLATKISFVNEIANLCDKVGANVGKVAAGMGLDKRIGPHFLKAGIGYGGSCFPKDTNALVQIAGNYRHDFELLKAVIKVNQQQQTLLVSKVAERLGDLKGKKLALLGLTFKPNTDDMRESPSIPISSMLLDKGAIVYGYDPIGFDKAKQCMDPRVRFAPTIESALKDADGALILTE